MSILEAGDVEAGDVEAGDEELSTQDQETQVLEPESGVRELPDEVSKELQPESHATEQSPNKPIVIEQESITEDKKPLAKKEDAIYETLIKKAATPEAVKEIETIKKESHELKPIDVWYLLIGESVLTFIASLAKIGIALVSGFVGAINILIGQTMGSVGSLFVGILKFIRGMITHGVERIRDGQSQQAAIISSQSNLTSREAVAAQRNESQDLAK